MFNYQKTLEDPNVGQNHFDPVFLLFELLLVASTAPQIFNCERLSVAPGKGSKNCNHFLSDEKGICLSRLSMF